MLDIPEWCHTTWSQLLCGKCDHKNLAVHIVSMQELQYIKNGEMFPSIQDWTSTFTFNGSRKVRSKQLWSVNFMGWMQRWILGLLFDLQLTSVLLGNPEIFNMSLRTFWWRVVEVKKNGTVPLSTENTCHELCTATMHWRPTLLCTDLFKTVIECTATNHMIFSQCIYTSFHGNLLPLAWIWVVIPHSLFWASLDSGDWGDSL